MSRRLTRWLLVACPFCAAKPGECCREDWNSAPMTDGVHRERYERFQPTTMRGRQANPMGRGHVRCPRCRSDDVTLSKPNAPVDARYVAAKCEQCDHAWHTVSPLAHSWLRAQEKVAATLRRL